MTLEVLLEDIGARVGAFTLTFNPDNKEAFHYSIGWDFEIPEDREEDAFPREQVFAESPLAAAKIVVGLIE